MTILIATDLHFSDKDKDSYRFGIFEFLDKQRAKHKASLILILGDITDAKDNHSSILVNRIVEGFNLLKTSVPVIILKGNHDYHSNPDSPFFDFLNHMKNIKFVTKPATWVTSEESKLLFLPHFHSKKEWDKFRLDIRPDFAFIHQTVTGAISESGQRLDGFSLKPLKRLKARAIFGGDVHKPHTIGPVTYVGPPYHVKFGDNFIPRCIVLDEKSGKYEDLHYECPRKWSLNIRDIQEIEFDHRLKRGDQVKVKLELTREEIPEWPVFKNRIVEVLKDLGLESFGIELKAKKGTKRKKDNENALNKSHITAPVDILGGFCKSEKLPNSIRKVGFKLLNR